MVPVNLRGPGKPKSLGNKFGLVPLLRKIAKVAAPLKENLAAGLLRLDDERRQLARLLGKNLTDKLIASNCSATNSTSGRAAFRRALKLATALCPYS